MLQDLSQSQIYNTDHSSLKLVKTTLDGLGSHTIQISHS
jgi:hypothetical protein